MVVSTDATCKDVTGTTVAVGALAELRQKPAAASTSFCDASGHLGTVVVVPSGARDAEVGIRIVTGLGKSPEACVDTGYLGGCIVARRALRFIPHQELMLKVHMSTDCRDVPCGATETCVRGRCVDGRVTDPTKCAVPPGCGDEALPPPPLRGQPVWGAAFVASGESIGWDVAADGSGSAIVVGTYSGTMDLGGKPLVSLGLHDYFVAKVDRSGGQVWSRSFGNALDQGEIHVAVDPFGNVVLAGAFAGTLDFGGPPLVSAGGTDVFVAKLDPLGKHLWSARYGDDKDQRASGVATGKDGYIAVGGSFAGKLVVGADTFQPKDVTGYDDLFLLHFSPSGAYRWGKQTTTNGADTGGRVTIDVGGDVIQASASYPGSTLTDALLASIDRYGTPVFSREYDLGGYDGMRSVATDPTTRDIVVTGYTSDAKGSLGGSPLTGSGVFVARYDWTGNYVWSRSLATGGSDRTAHVAVDQQGHAAVAGNFTTTVDLDKKLTAAGLQSAFVTKLDEKGGFRWGLGYGSSVETCGVATDPDDAVYVAGTLLDGTLDLAPVKLGPRSVKTAYLLRLTP